MVTRYQLQSIYVLGGLMLLLCGCALFGGKPATPDEQALCLQGCSVLAERAAGLCRVANCGVPPTPTTATVAPTAEVTPTSTPTVTVSTPATATVTPTSEGTATVGPTPTSTPSETAVPVGGTCTSTRDLPAAPRSAAQVTNSENFWLEMNPDKWRQHGVQRQVLPEFVNVYYFGVVELLRSIGREAVVDNCGGSGPCGEIAVAVRGDALMHEQYSILVSSGDVRPPMNGDKPNGFMAVCRPRGFQPSGNPGELPTATPKQVAMATCPPLESVSCGQKGGNSKFKASDGSGDTCLLLDCTARFAGNVPCNVEHPNCGDAGNVFPFAGDACEPAPGSFHADITAKRSAPAGYNEGKLCGPAGSAWSITTSISASAKDKASRPMDLSRFRPKTVAGVL